MPKGKKCIPALSQRRFQNRTFGNVPPPSSLLILTPKSSAANLEKNSKEKKRLLQISNVQDCWCKLHCTLAAPWNRSEISNSKMKKVYFPPTRSPFPCPPPPPESEVSERLHLRRSLFFISSGGGKEEKKSKKPLSSSSSSSCQSEFTFALKAPCEKVILVFPPFLLFWPEGQGGEKERGPSPPSIPFLRRLPKMCGEIATWTFLLRRRRRPTMGRRSKLRDPISTTYL